MPNSDGIEFIDLGSNEPGLVAVKVKGEITGAAMAAFVSRVEALHAAHDKLRLFVDMTEYSGFEWAVVQEKLANFRTLMTSFDRLAYVVDADWMATWIGLVDAVTPMHIRAFKPADRQKAIDWVLAN
ncbi:MAG: STAS/SEC14 domain-containing protein [Hyphomicrobiales bacterium]|nr:STAS/SEC14 domain-containing protein [Hyphomicrobiales bacterium]